MVAFLNFLLLAALLKSWNLKPFTEYTWSTAENFWVTFKMADYKLENFLPDENYTTNKIEVNTIYCKHTM